MSENKTLKINPDLFKLKKNKVKNKTENKPKIDKEQNQSTNKIKHELLKRVKEYQKNQENQEKKTSLNICDTNINSTFENIFEKEFNNSLQFLQKISNNSKKKTLKQKRDNLVLQVDTNPPKDLDNIVYETNTPRFGCLKNGTQPSYSTQSLKNNIKKNVKLNIEPIIEPRSVSNTIKPEILHPEKIDIIPTVSTNTPQETPKINISLPPITPIKPITPITPIKPITPVTPVISLNNAIMSSEILDNKSEDTVTNIINNNNLLQNSTIQIQEKENIEDKIPKIRRCTRQYTYKLGKTNNKVGVLIKSRDTIKKNNKNISDIKSTSIQNVKQYLRDNNLIKLGSSAPPDVLKKMYETCMLSGDINNINKDNIIHNYLNS